jgi:hypothetical protein
VLASLLSVLLASAYAAPAPARVVLVTWDGVRTQELLGNKPSSDVPEITQLNGDQAPLLPHFWSTLVGQGVLFGDYRVGNKMWIGNNAGVSMPGYEAIFSGATQPCGDNQCSRIGVETFPERVRRVLGLKKSEVAAFASWDKIDEAIQHDAGAIHYVYIKDKDDEVFQKGLAYLKDKKPVFLYMMFGWSDDRAHAGDYKGVVDALRQYDDWLNQLVAVVDSMHDMPTTLIVTTDHGRGIGAEWRNHGHAVLADSRPVWLYARGPSVPRLGPAANGSDHTQIDIRPTIEALFGLCPCRGCTQGFTQIAQPPSSCGQP